MDAPENIERINRTLTSEVERKVLVWLAVRLPAWVTPDQLTALGLIAAVGIGVSYLAANFSLAYLWLANMGWVIHWFADSLDGTLARVRKMERPKYGHYVDHFVDTIATIIIVFGVAYSSLAHPTALFLLLVSYMFLSIHAYLWGAVRGIFRISYGFVGPTEARIFYIFLNLWVLTVGDSRFPLGPFVLSLFDVAAIGLSIFFVAMTLRHGWRSIGELKRLGI